MEYQKAVDLARALEGAHENVVESVCSALGLGWTYQENGRRVPDTRNLSVEDAEKIGAIEGAWQAFATTVIKAAGGVGTPQSILAMDREARDAANAAYQKAYAEAMGGGGAA